MDVFLVCPRFIFGYTNCIVNIQMIETRLAMSSSLKSRVKKPDIRRSGDSCVPRSYESPTRDMAADKTRKRLVAAARAILTNPRSRTPFSLEAVASRARVTRLTVYNQFKNRRGLLEAVFDDVAQMGRLDRLSQVFTQRYT